MVLKLTDVQPNPHQQVAARVIAAVTAALAELEPLERPHATTVPKVRSNSGVDIGFIVAVVGAIETTPSLESLKQIVDLAAAHDSIDYIQAMQPLADKLETLLRAVKFTIASRKADTGAQTLRAYQILKGMSRDEKLGLTPQLAIAKRALGRSRAKVRTAPPAGPLETGKEVPQPKA